MHDCITANIRNYLDTDLRPYCPALKYTQHNLACQHLYIIIINANLLPATHPVLFNVGLIVLPLREKGTLTLNICSQKDDTLSTITIFPRAFLHRVIFNMWPRGSMYRPHFTILTTQNSNAHHFTKAGHNIGSMRYTGIEVPSTLSRGRHCKSKLP